VSGARQRRAGAEPAWAELDDVDLLGVRFDRLRIQAEGGLLEPRIERLHAELEAAGITLRPHVWLSTDWFSPDGVPGIAVPFYLAHPRLVRLERAQMLEAEGVPARTCMKLQRHEAGHAVETAYRLSRRRLYKETFGKRSATYRRRYTFDPLAPGFVQHLDRWYAQSHPCEDFAESFAVWLGSRGRWRARYADSDALHKLEAVDALMDSIRGTRPLVRSAERTESIAKLGTTLGDHYRDRRWTAESDPPPPFERALRKRFLPGRPWTRTASAAALLRRVRPRLVRRAARELGYDPYTCDQVVLLMIHRTRQLGLSTRRGLAGYEPGPFVRMIRESVRAYARGDHRLAR